ncbi:hypothetical protein G8767_34785 [Rhodococcus sp. IC4_135]|uniref:hypothetical protein n=1 Tax=Rhodococcus sp. IC4_135 TaxID=2715537 RepID=UPI001421AA08|nr:hypothetical protein [Rhodococcus sp. IC4_135]
MMYQTVEESDAAEERRRRREEAREEAREIEQPGEPLTRNDSGISTTVLASLTELSTQRPGLAELTQRPGWRERLEMRAKGEEPVAAELAKASAFTLVGTLPTGNVSRAPQIPRVRTQLIEFAKQNVGQWIHYEKSTEDPFKSVDTFGGQVRRGQGGFGPGFEAAVRSKRLYVRYVGEQPE